MKQSYVTEIELKLSNGTSWWSWMDEHETMSEGVASFQNYVDWEHQPGRRDRDRSARGSVGPRPSKPHVPRRVRLTLYDGPRKAKVLRQK